MFEINSEVSFDAAHFLEDYRGKCKNLHGHRYRVCYCVSSDGLRPDGGQAGMVADFGELKEMMSEITERFDHKLLMRQPVDDKSKHFLQACENMNFEVMLFDSPTTAECLARTIYNSYSLKLRQLCGESISLRYIKVYETPTNCAVYYGEHK